MSYIAHTSATTAGGRVSNSATQLTNRATVLMLNHFLAVLRHACAHTQGTLVMTLHIEHIGQHSAAYRSLGSIAVMRRKKTSRVKRAKRASPSSQVAHDIKPIAKRRGEYVHSVGTP